MTAYTPNYANCVDATHDNFDKNKAKPTETNQLQVYGT